MQKGDRRLTAVCRSIPMFDALELRFDINGRLLHSQLYRGAALANIKPDADAKRAGETALRLDGGKHTWLIEKRVSCL